MGESHKIRLMVADDLPLVRLGVKRMLAGSEVELTIEANHTAEAVEAARSGRCDVALVDIGLPPGNGLQALSEMKAARPDLAVILFLDVSHSAFVARGVSLGASGCLSKTCSAEQMLAAFRTVAAGRDLWSREDLRRISGSLASFPVVGGANVPLTKRESEVLKHVVEGETNNQIADKLKISHETVKEHVQHILQKVGLRDRTQVAVWAVRNGIV